MRSSSVIEFKMTTWMPDEVISPSESRAHQIQIIPKHQMSPRSSHCHRRVWLLMWYSGVFSEILCLFCARCNGVHILKKLHFWFHQTTEYLLSKSFPGKCEMDILVISKNNNDFLKFNNYLYVTAGNTHLHASSHQVNPWTHQTGIFPVHSLRPHVSRDNSWRAVRSTTAMQVLPDLPSANWSTRCPKIQQHREGSNQEIQSNSYDQQRLGKQKPAGCWRRP